MGGSGVAVGRMHRIPALREERHSSPQQNQKRRSWRGLMRSPIFAFAWCSENRKWAQGVLQPNLGFLVISETSHRLKTCNQISEKLWGALSGEG